MEGLAHASSATERLPYPSRFSTDGNSYDVRLENRNRRATFTYPQVAKTARRGAAWKRSTQGSTSPPMTMASPELQPPWPARFSVLQF